jgi:hypothetical protein
VITFDKDIQDVVANPGLTVTATAVGGQAPVVGALAVAGNQLIIPLTGSVNRTCVTLTIDGVKGVDGSVASAPYTQKLTYVLADVDGDHKCASSDLVLIKQKQAAFTNVTGETFMYDVDCNSKCASSDLVLVKQNQAAFSVTACDN